MAESLRDMSITIEVLDANSLVVLEEIDNALTLIRESMGKALAAAAAFSAAVSAAFAAAGAAALNEARNVAILGSEVALNADAMALTTDEYQEFGYAIRSTGGDMHDFADALGTIADKAIDAKAGGKTMTEDFALLGISVDKLRTKRPIDLFEQLADAFKATTDPTRRLAAASRILGDDTARKLLPLLRKGSVGIRQFREEARKAGIVLDKETIKQSQEYEAVSRRLSDTIDGLRKTIGAAFLPALIDITDHLGKAVTRAKEFIEPLIKMVDPKILLGIAGVAIGIGAVGSAVLGLAAALIFAAPVFTAFAAGISVVAGVLGVLSIPLDAIALALGVALFQALVVAGLALGAFILLGTEVAYILEDLYVYSTGGTSAIGTFFAAFGQQEGILGATARLLGAIVEQLAAMADLGLVVADLFAQGVVVAFNAASSAAATLLDKLAPITGLLSMGIAAAIDQSASNISTGAGLTGQAAAGLGGAGFVPLLSGVREGERTGNSFRGGDRTTFNQRVNMTIQGAGDPSAVGEETARALQESTYRQSMAGIADREVP